MPDTAYRTDGKGVPTLVRLSLFYAAIYLSSGVSLPYIGTYLRDRGMTGGEIGLILAVPLLLKPFTGASLAVWADGFTLRRTPMVLLLVGAGLGYAGLLIAPNLWWFILAWFIGQTLLRLGLGNIVRAEDGPFPKLNPEFVVRAQPDIVMAEQRNVDAMAGRPGWSRLHALRDGRTCGFSSERYEVLVRPGPRLGEGALLLAGCLAALRSASP